MNDLEALLDEAYCVRADDPATAWALYHRAAQGARLEDQPAVLAHALRHLSDIDRENDQIDRARTEADEAVILYRTQVVSDALSLANALRLAALVRSGQDARPYWTEARDLYAKLDVLDGVEDCDRNLANSALSNDGALQ